VVKYAGKYGMKCLIFNVDKGHLLRRPAGAYRIAHFLREHGWDAEVIEFTTFWSLEQLKELCKQRIDSSVKFIGLSYLFVDEPIEQIEIFGTWFKSTYPDIKILLGSPNKYRFNSSYIDYNINGFGEVALLELLKYLFSNGPSPKFSMFTNSGKNIEANSSYPAYPLSSLNILYEDRDFLEPHEWLGIEFARGCKFACAFCNYPVLGVKGDHTRDAEDFEIQVRDAYDRFGITKYYVADETFNDRTEKVTKFANVVDKLNFEPFFTGCVRADLMISRPDDKEELLRMKFLGQLYGVESFCTPASRSIGKGMDSDRMKQGLIDIRNYFENNDSKRFRGTISLIAGLPHESQDSLYETKQWLLDHWQGQSFNMIPLEVPISEFDSPSKIGINWSKYGYTDISDDPKYKDYKLRNMITAKTQLFWKNDHMDIDIAHKIAKEVENIKYENDNDFRIINFALMRIGLPTDLDKLLLVLEKDNYPKFPREFIDLYIEKKLNL
jgi:radical SAM superfamily enzyme YgiQ (UPF0313 family)